MKYSAFILLLSSALLGGCGDDPVERAIALQSETLNYICECGIARGDYTTRAECEAANSEVTFSASEQACFERVLDSASSADVEATECSIDALEAQLDCGRSLGCTPDSVDLQRCNDQYEAAAQACALPSTATQEMFSACSES